MLPGVGSKLWGKQMASDHATIVNSLLQGPDVRWTKYDVYPSIHYLRPLGSPTFVTYSFDSAPPTGTPVATPGFRSLNDAERQNVRAAANLWDQASGLVLREVSAGQGDIQVGAYNFAGTGNSGSSGYAYYPGPSFAGDIWFNTANDATNAVTVFLALHEFGHALGLKHPFDPGRTGVLLPREEDSTANTVMSYTGIGTPALGAYDVAAIQYLYGPNVGVEALYPAGYTAEGYLAANPDLLRGFGPNIGAANEHYLMAGMREGRSITFDALRYLAGNPDLLTAFGLDQRAATQHYVYSGAVEGRSATSFDPMLYLASHRDLAVALGTNTTAATQHYLQNGRAEGRGVTFDKYLYMAANRDVLGAFLFNPDGATRHYIEHGAAEGRPTTGGFDAQSYLRANADLAAAFGSDETAATRHYVQYGVREGRPTFVIPTMTVPPVVARIGVEEPAFPSITGMQGALATPGTDQGAAGLVREVLPGLREADAAMDTRSRPEEARLMLAGTAETGFFGADRSFTAPAFHGPS
ncbi:matrixin family metalloprotease [Azospirillum doebereinerae]